MKYKAVFFDLDGTLMDTSEGIFINAIDSMKALNVEIPEDSDLRKFIGPPLRECFRLAFNVQDEALLDKLSEQYKKTYRARGLHLKACFYPGMLETLKELKRLGYKTAITSMKGEDLVKKMAYDFNVTSLFDGLFGFEDNTEKTTKKDIVLFACKSLSLEPKDCVLVGDTSIDQIGAMEAGTDFIKVNWGFGFTKDEKSSISRPEEILSIVESL